MMILAADIGGSQARLLLARRKPGGWEPVRQQIFPSSDFPSLDALLRAFLRSGEQPGCACFAVAGPVGGGHAALTNLPWEVDAAALGAAFGLRRVEVVNDFAAQAHGLPLLGPGDVYTLQHGEPAAHGLKALIGAGTGLGMALLADDGGRRVALPSEGGHVDFAPRTPEEIALLQHLLGRHRRVSLELVLSGHGLERIYRHVAGLADDAPADARAIGTAALAGDTHATAAATLFARLLASAAGNLALASLARGGVYLSGGIAPKLLPILRQPAVREAFCDKPPMRALLERIPLHVVTDELLGLKGAAQVAARLGGSAD